MVSQVRSPKMCDYSLHRISSRPAKVGDKLTMTLVPAHAGSLRQGQSGHADCFAKCLLWTMNVRLWPKADIVAWTSGGQNARVDYRWASAIRCKLIREWLEE